MNQVLKCIFLVAALVATVTANATVQMTGEYKPNEVIVKYRDGVRRNRFTMESLYSDIEVVKVKRFSGTMRQFEQLTVTENSDLRDVIAQIEKNPIVEYAQPNYILKALPVVAKDDDSGNPYEGVPCIPGMEVPGCTPMPCVFPGFPPGCDDSGNPGEPGNPGNPGGPSRPPVSGKPDDVNPRVPDPKMDQVYGINKIGAPNAWNKTRGLQDVVVAVIDTGVDYNHEDLSFNMWRNANSAEKGDIVGWDFIHNDNLPFDDHSHGSHCAGVIGAVGENGKGITGVNQRVSIMALKFLSAEGSGDTAGAIRSIDYAIEHGAKVLSNSWGGKGDDDNRGLRDAIKRAEAKGVLFIAAAGNDGTDNDRDPTYPASMNEPNMITVAATDRNDRLASFSNTGKQSVHVAAPGVDIYSTVKGGAYGKMSGTSMACPHVAGAAALIWSANPNMTYQQVKEKVMQSVDKIPALEGKTVTGGRINVARAVGAI